jgi:hypothetical protein
MKMRSSEIVAGAALVGMAALFLTERPARRRLQTFPQQKTSAVARQLDRGAAILALSVFCDSAVEHYRGSFQNRAMYVPLAVSALAACTNLGCSLADRSDHRRGRTIVNGAAATTGVAGLAFHAYNIFKRPGGLSWLNLFYAAPIGAPAALVLAAALGQAAERLRAGYRTQTALLARPMGRVLAGIASLGLFGTVSEAALLHFRGAFQNPAMVLPVSVPPVASAMLAVTAMQPNRTLTSLTRGALKLTALLGFAGVGFHVYGISRAMGGWRNWSQNVVDGPPLPAPPSFTALALAGLAAITLIEEGKDG